MDRGRVIDNVQNVNARFIDQYGAAGKTSVKTSNPPGKVFLKKAASLLFH